ncbi:MAG: hypothetical protein H6993_15335 [Pseudomonadales bacterium]|nr:hypothetical protein [Pseudomonadales bacterium]MCP5185336.1 hypothetical protein [Pseudomonadales bacterium]
MSRLSAFAIHFGISAALFLVLAAIILTWWYPGFFFETDGGWQGIRIIAAVDLVLGPCLTLVVFRKGKPGLATDLTLIGLFQALCLAGGILVVYSERPLAMVMVDDAFFSMSSDDFTDFGVEPPDLSAFPGKGPKWVSVRIPDDIQAAGDLRREALTTNRPLRTYHELYQAYSPAQLELARATPEDELRAFDVNVHALDAWLKENGGSIQDYAFFPLGTRYNMAFLGFRRENMEPLGVLYTPAPT